MIKPIIKNWIKYFATTLALSGMLVVGGCDTDNRQADNDYTQDVEAAENDIGDPTREDVRQDVDAETYDTEEQSAQEANETEQANQTQDTQYERMNNRANQGTGTSAPRAEGINNMESHLEEHSNANKEATEALTDRELEEAKTTGIYEGETMTADQQQGTATQGQDNGTTQQNNRLDQNEDANIGRQGTTTQQGQQDTMQQNQQGTQQNADDRRQGGVPEEGRTQGTDSQVEYETDRQGTTEMEMDRQNQNQGTTTQQGQQENADRADQTYDQDVILGEGAEDETENVRKGESEAYESDYIIEEGANRTGEVEGTGNEMNQNQNQGTTTQQDTDADAPIQETRQGDDVSRQGGTNLKGMEERHEGTDTDQQGTMQQNQQGTQQQDQQDTVQQDESAGVIIYERYSVVYPEDSYTEEDRQKMEDIMGEYEDRRERMRGQMDTETGAYMSPEVDAQPKQGYDQLMNQIQENLDYPQDAQAADIEGTIFVNFIVDENGNITKAKAVDDVVVPASTTGVDPRNPLNFSDQEIQDAIKEMRKEAVEAVEATSGQWEPGMQGGEPVKSELQIPVRFNLAEIGGTGVR